jgi:hypothetical protein
LLFRLQALGVLHPLLFALKGSRHYFLEGFLKCSLMMMIMLVMMIVAVVVVVVVVVVVTVMTIVITTMTTISTIIFRVESFY